MEAARESQSTAWGRIAESRVKTRGAVSVALPLAAGLALRIWMLKWLFEVNGDSLIYGGVAKNLLQHGSFALTLPNGEMYPTLIRLPGYPAFSCGLLPALRDGELLCRGVRADCDGIAGLPAAGRLCAAHCAAQAQRQGAALATLWLAALCPFTASYAVLPLTETPTIVRAGAGNVGRWRAFATGQGGSTRSGSLLQLPGRRCCGPTVHWPQ